jgi:plastocyanin
MSAKQKIAVLATVAALGSGTIPAVTVALSDGAHAAGAHASSSHTVILQHDRFLPGSVSIRRGESVTWVWRDGNVVHNVIGASFGSGLMSKGTFTVRFTHSGRYNYKCTIHPHMDGVVVVH